MADIISSLFGLSPIQQQYENSARQRDMDLGSLWGQATTTGFMTPDQAQNHINRQGAQAALAGAGVRALGGLFGLQDPQLKRATDLEGILASTQQEVGMDNPTEFYPALQQRLNDAGFTREAMLIGMQGEKAIQDYKLNAAKVANEDAQAIKNKREPSDKRFLSVGKNVFDTETQSWVTLPEEATSNQDGSEGTDKLLGVAVATLQNPNASPEDKTRAKAIYEQLLPLKQPVQLTQPTPIQVTDKTGNVTLVNPVTKEKTPLGNIGKPSATYEKIEGEKKKVLIDTNFAINQLETVLADGTFDKATSSGIGALVDKGAGAFGVDTEGAIAIGKLKPVFDLVLKQVPRFEGPQSNTDVISYKEAAGNFANPDVPLRVKKEAALKILSIMKARKGQFIDSSSVGTEADPLYNKEEATVSTKSKSAPSNEYKRYLARWNELKNDKEGQRALTAAARKAGIVK